MNMNTKITERLLKSRINTMKLWSQKSFRIPGLIFILVLILKNPFIACSNPNSSFYNKILNDFDTTSYFIALDIKSPYYKGRTIIENNNLYMYLHKSKDLVRQKFIKVDVLESVIYNANKGSDNFISKYFNGTVLNFGITEKEQNAIINQLFFWDIPAKIEKLTGELIIG